MYFKNILEIHLEDIYVLYFQWLLLNKTNKLIITFQQLQQKYNFFKSLRQGEKKAESGTESGSVFRVLIGSV